MNKIVKERSSLLFLTFLILCCNQSFAEGQDGIANIINNAVNLGYWFMTFTNVLVYTVIGGLLIKVLFLKDNLKIENRNLKSFSISLLISVLLTIIFQDKFTFLIYNAL